MHLCYCIWVFILINKTCGFENLKSWRNIENKKKWNTYMDKELYKTTKKHKMPVFEQANHWRKIQKAYKQNDASFEK